MLGPQLRLKVRLEKKWFRVCKPFDLSTFRSRIAAIRQDMEQVTQKRFRCLAPRAAYNWIEAFFILYGLGLLVLHKSPE